MLHAHGPIETTVVWIRCRNTAKGRILVVQVDELRRHDKSKGVLNMTRILGDATNTRVES